MHKDDRCYDCDKRFNEDEVVKWKIWYGVLRPVCYECWKEFMVIKERNK